MNKILNISLISSALLLSSCATQSGWTPTIDTFDNENAYRLEQDLEDCRQLAERASEGTGAVQKTASSTFIGGLVGALSGAVLGAISGDAGRGAAYGAASGAIGGGIREGLSGSSSESEFKRAYSNCIRNRGHHVVN
jgi:outer membrane lipoprotein SlyB